MKRRRDGVGGKWMREGVGGERMREGVGGETEEGRGRE